MRGKFHLPFFIVLFALLALAVPAGAATTGGAAYEERQSPADAKPTVAGRKAKLVNGVAHAPEEAPQAVKEAIWAANRLQAKPYRYGGGHAKVEDSGYDCSGTVSYALIHAKLLKAPLDSGSFMRWGKAGRGRWITVYTNPGHAYMHIAGLRLDTSAAGDRSGAKGPRWRPKLRSPRGFKARRIAGL